MSSSDFTFSIPEPTILPDEEYRAGIRRCIENPGRTCLSYWYPRIRDIVRTPKTEIIQTDALLVNMCEGGKVDGIEHFLHELSAAALRIGLPCFLRTGQTSNKHYWSRTCYLSDLSKLHQHVYELVEFSEICDFMGLPSHTWVVREMLQTEPAFTAFPGGMPVTKERRYFVCGGDVVCHHPYWPEMSIRNPSIEDWRDRLAVLNHESNEEIAELTALSSMVGAALGDDWSIDWLWTKDGWYLTDMAEAARSFHWDGCEANRWSR